MVEAAADERFEDEDAVVVGEDARDADVVLAGERAAAVVLGVARLDLGVGDHVAAGVAALGGGGLLGGVGDQARRDRLAEQALEDRRARGERVQVLELAVVGEGEERRADLGGRDAAAWRRCGRATWWTSPSSA